MCTRTRGTMESLGARNIALSTSYGGSNSVASAADCQEKTCVSSSLSFPGDDVVVQVVDSGGTVGEERTNSNPAADPALIGGVGVGVGVGGSLRGAALEELSRSWTHSSQLKEWRDEEKALRSRLHRKEQNLSAAQSEIYQLLGLFSLFQGVIFTALAQSTILTCAYWWSPFGLSLTVMAITLVALQQKLKVFYDVQKEVAGIKLQADALFDSILDLKKKGCAFDLADIGSQPRITVAHELQSHYCSARGLRRLLVKYSYAFAVTFIVLFLSSIILFSCRPILCRGCKCKS